MIETPRGVRFAPSPTGRFHFGNLRTGWISERWARALGELWIVRFEDIDSPRVVAGAAEAQLADMNALGLVPDEVTIQSARRSRHFSLFERAVTTGVLYPCFCSRKEVQEALGGIASAPHREIPIYTGHCRDRAWTETPRTGPGGVAWRFRSADESGGQDFIAVRTAFSAPDPESFVPAYHWACAIDDFDGNYRLLVRAWDLASSTPLQREIQAWLAREEGVSPRIPAVFHTSLVTQNDGHRLEKRTAGVTLPEMLAAGWSVARIINGFDASFPVVPTEFKLGEISGEPERERRLADLGFSPDDPPYA